MQGDVVIDTNAYDDAAINRQIHHLGMAKKIHDEMERYYIPHMDFKAIEGRRVKTLGRILELIAERHPASAD
jgi:hypothetical protein